MEGNESATAISIDLLEQFGELDGVLLDLPLLRSSCTQACTKIATPIAATLKAIRIGPEARRVGKATSAIRGLEDALRRDQAARGVDIHAADVTDALALVFEDMLPHLIFQG